MRLFVSALEYSANIHLKYLLREMIKSENIELCGIFDESIISESNKELTESKNTLKGTTLCNIDSIAVMGFIDVLKRVRFFLELRKKCINLALECDKILLMDSSSFNIPLAKRIKKRDLHKMIMYYILPQVWAWKPWRARIIEANCDKLAAILPFEVGCYEKKAKFVGHPLLDEIRQFRGGNSPLELHSARLRANFGHSQTPSLASSPKTKFPVKFAKNYESQTENPSVVDSTQSVESSEKIKSKKPIKSFCYFWLSPKVESPLPLNPNLSNNAPQSELPTQGTNSHNTKIFTFMPGSRLSEINRIFPIFLQVKDELKKRDSKAQFNLVVPKKFNGKNLSEIYGDINDFHITFDAHTSLLQSTFAFICSGTATLECALIGTPFVLGYKCRALEAFIAKRFLHIRFVGLANLLYSHIAPDSRFHEELLQENLNAKNLLDSYHNANPNDFLAKSLALRAYLKSGSARAVAQWLLEK